MNWETVSFVFSSDLRFKILLKLGESERTPKQLASAIDKPMSHVSRTLKELTHRGLVECLTPNRKKARFYSITNLGNEVMVEINKLTKHE